MKLQKIKTHYGLKQMSHLNKIEYNIVYAKDKNSK